MFKKPGLETETVKQALLFVNKKKQKNFDSRGLWL
jgi:hypothetical protein